MKRLAKNNEPKRENEYKEIPKTESQGNGKKNVN